MYADPGCVLLLPIWLGVNCLTCLNVTLTHKPAPACHPPEHVASISTSLPPLPLPPTSILPLSWWVRRASSLSFLILASAGFPASIRSILHSCIATDHFRSDRGLPIGQVGLPVQPAGKDRSGFIRRAVHAQCVSQVLYLTHHHHPPKST